LQLTSTQIGLAALLNFVAFVIGGFIVGIKSAGRTIVEPGIAAAVAVAIALLLSGSLSIGSLLAGGLVPFLAGLLGGWLGEKRQDAKAGIQE
jgi:hydrogenase/urease accessory protein HupE